MGWEGGLDLCDAGHVQGQGQVFERREHVIGPAGSIPREIVG